MLTKKQKAAWTRNHLIMRLRGAYHLFRGMSGNTPQTPSAIRGRAYTIATNIDQIIVAMNAESEAARIEARREKYSSERIMERK